MGLGNYPFATLTTIRSMAFRLLEKVTVEKIAHTGLAVIDLMETIRSTQPFKVPKKPSGGLLNLGSIPVNDFALAQHLIATNDPEMAKIIKDAGDVPVLLAYLAIITSRPELPAEYWLESALPFAVETLAIEGKEAERWRLELKTESDSAAKLLSKTNSVNASMPRPNAKSPLKTAVINAMGKEKKGCQDFKTFMGMWRRAHIDGLTIKEATGNSMTYIITDENGDLGEKSYTWGSLEAMYSKA